MNNSMKRMSVFIAVLMVLGLFSCRTHTKTVEHIPEPEYRNAWNYSMAPVQKLNHPATVLSKETSAMMGPFENLKSEKGRQLLQKHASENYAFGQVDIVQPDLDPGATDHLEQIPEVHAIKNQNSIHESTWYRWLKAKAGILLGGVAFTALLIMMLIRAGRRNRIGLWAHRNKSLARGVLIPCQAALLLSGLYAGKQLGALGITGSDSAALAFAGIGLAGVMLYPFKQFKTGLMANSAVKHKVFAGLLTGAGLCAAINMGATEGVPVASAASGDYIAGKIFLTLLAIAAFLMIGYVLAIITCELICLDLVVLAFLVGGGGGALSIYLLYRALMSIWGNRYKSIPMETQIRGKS